MALRNVTIKSRVNSLWILPPTPSPEISPQNVLCSLFRYPDNYTSETAQGRTMRLVKGDLKLCYINYGVEGPWCMWKRLKKLATAVLGYWDHYRLEVSSSAKMKKAETTRTCYVGVEERQTEGEAVGESQIQNGSMLGQLCATSSHICHGPSRKVCACGQHHKDDSNKLDKSVI